VVGRIVDQSNHQPGPVRELQLELAEIGKVARLRDGELEREAGARATRQEPRPPGTIEIISRRGAVAIDENGCPHLPAGGSFNEETIRIHKEDRRITSENSIALKCIFV
jgi:hypothetical protein